MTDQEWTPRSALFVFVGLVPRESERDTIWRTPRFDMSVRRDDAEMDERFIREAGRAGEIARLSEPVLNELGCSLVRVKVSSRDGGTVQIMVERTDREISIEDCSAISRRISPLLDAHDPFSGGYRLEVSSPGIDRPLVRPRDFETWNGYEAKIELKELIDGRKRFRGRIEGFEEGEVRLQLALDEETDPITVGFPLTLIAEAKLVFSDELLQAAAKT